MLLQLEAPVRVEIVLLVQPLDALAEAGHFRIGEEALQVPLPPLLQQLHRPLYRPQPILILLRPLLLPQRCTIGEHHSGTSFRNIIREHHSGTSFRNIIQEHLGEHLGREVGGQFARNIRGSRLY